MCRARGHLREAVTLVMRMMSAKCGKIYATNVFYVQRRCQDSSMNLRLKPISVLDNRELEFCGLQGGRMEVQWSQFG